MVHALYYYYHHCLVVSDAKNMSIINESEVQPLTVEKNLLELRNSSHH